MGKYVVDESKPHLGGNFAGGDPATWCPSAWDYVVKKYNVKSVMDVGSGRGYAAQWFSNQGLTVTAIEGLKENVDNAIVSTSLHDLTEGAFVNPVDFVNCIEVVEHIEEKFLDNLLTTLCQGKYLLMTHAVPGQRGWHHVNCQPSEYWIKHLDARGFSLSVEDTAEIQKLAAQDGGKHIARNGMIFIKR
jgi:cyclopropane fatty-acyl-phospholipid synthase-like methyltransferase